MQPESLLQRADGDARRLVTVAATDWGRPVPDCPGWDAAALVRHSGGILLWMAAIVGSGERVSRRTLAPGPERPLDLPSWYLDALEGALHTLGSAPPAFATWTFSTTGDHTVGWWCRRLAVEFAIHRFDMEHGASADGGGSPADLDGEVAGAGIDEFMVEFLPGLLDREGIVGLSGTLHLQATDGPTEWWIDLDAGGPARPEHAEAPTTARGTRSDLLLWMTNRKLPDVLEVVGDRTVLDHWSQLGR